MKTRIFAMCLSLLMIISMIPMGAISVNAAECKHENIWDKYGDGYYSCKDCGKGLDQIEMEANCKHESLVELFDGVFYCALCMKEIYRETQPEETEPGETEHVHVEVTVPGKAATCTEAGLTDGVSCSECGEILVAQEAIPALGHSYDAGVVTKEPTETAAGERTYTCTVCKETKTEEIRPTGCMHDSVQNKYGDGVYYCNYCGLELFKIIETGSATDPAECKHENMWDKYGDGYYSCKDCGKGLDEIEKEANCKHENLVEVFPGVFWCTNCWKEFRQETEHVHIEVTVPGKAATCTEPGLTDGKYCSDCGTIIVRRETIAALGHQEEITIGKDATCTKSGLTNGKICSVCKTVIVAQEIIPSNGHDYRDGKCYVCGETEPNGEETEVNVKRVAGGSRYSTCTKVADELKATLGGEPFDAVIVASGADFPDALAGTYLAAVKKAPILLIDDGHIEMMVKYIKENMAGDGIIYILGSEKAVSKKAADELAAVGNVKRLGGKSRFITNLRILEEMDAKTGELLVVYSVAPWDALSVSSSGCPVLLVNETLRNDQKQYLETTNFDRITVIGSNKVISDDLMKELSAYCGDVGRVYGSSRYKTTIEVAKYFYGTKNGSVVLACGNNFPDGLCSGALAYAKKAPVILTDVERESLAAGYVTDYNIQTGYVIGSAKVVSDASVRKAFNMTETDIIK